MPMTVMESYPEAAGFIPSFLSELDPRGAVEQLDEHYMDGWCDFAGKEKFTLYTMKLVYRDGQGPDETFHLKAAIFMRNEVIMIFDADLVVVRQDNGDWRLARMT